MIYHQQAARGGVRSLEMNAIAPTSSPFLGTRRGRASPMVWCNRLTVSSPLVGPSAQPAVTSVRRSTTARRSSGIATISTKRSSPRHTPPASRRSGRRYRISPGPLWFSTVRRPATFYEPAGEGPFPTILHVGGYDGTAEALGPSDLRRLERVPRAERSTEGQNSSRSHCASTASRRSSSLTSETQPGFSEPAGESVVGGLLAAYCPSDLERPVPAAEAVLDHDGETS